MNMIRVRVWGPHEKEIMRTDYAGLPWGEISPDYTIKAIDAAHVKNTMQEALEEALDRDVSLVFEDAAEFDYDIWDTDGLLEEDVEDALIKCEAILTEAWDIVEHGEGW